MWEKNQGIILIWLLSPLPKYLTYVHVRKREKQRIFLYELLFLSFRSSGSLPHKLLRENPNIEINPIREAPSFFQSMFFLNLSGYIFFLGLNYRNLYHDCFCQNWRCVLTMPTVIAEIPGVVGFVLKVLWLSASLSFTLLLLPKSKYIMLQVSDVSMKVSLILIVLI